MLTAFVVAPAGMPMSAPAHRPVTLPTATEMSTARRWVSAHMPAPGAVRAAPGVGGIEAGLVVIRNHSPVQLNARAGAPVVIGGVTYAHGLYCHGLSKVVVRLPGPAASFAALASKSPSTQGF